MNYNYPYMQSQQVPPVSTIYGKVVDNIEMAKCQDVPIGNYSVFPKSDLSSIYVKSWNMDGSTKFVTYVPQVIDTVSNDPYIGILQGIQCSLEELVKKTNGQSSVANKLKRKEVSDDE